MPHSAIRWEWDVLLWKLAFWCVLMPLWLSVGIRRSVWHCCRNSGGSFWLLLASDRAGLSLSKFSFRQKNNTFFCNCIVCDLQNVSHVFCSINQLLKVKWQCGMASRGARLDVHWEMHLLHTWSVKWQLTKSVETKLVCALLECVLQGTRRMHWFFQHAQVHLSIWPFQQKPGTLLPNGRMLLGSHSWCGGNPQMWVKVGTVLCV